MPNRPHNPADVIERLVNGHAGLVYATGFRVLGRAVLTDEEMSEAWYGLLLAARMFDESKGYRFTTYATKAITRALITCSMKARTRRARFGGNFDVSVRCRGQVDVPQEYRPGVAEVRAAIPDWKSRDPDRLRKVFDRRCEGRTLSEVAEELGVSRERARQYQQIIVRELRVAFRQYLETVCD